MNIQILDVATASNEALEDAARLTLALVAELHPDEPQDPVASVVTAWRALPASVMQRAVHAYEEGRLIARARLFWHGPGAVEARVGVDVAADVRRRGIGTHLLRELMGIVPPQASVVSATTSTDPGRSFARRYGMREVHQEHTNRLDLSMRRRRRTSARRLRRELRDLSASKPQTRTRVRVR